MRNAINGRDFVQMIFSASHALNENQQQLNDLNVFPVPDGDTGTNMSMTMSTAASALEKSVPDSLSAAADSTANALLRGARGNSGVILSLLFRGMSKALKGKESCNASDFAKAMREGVDAAYKAVMKPAEGTVLTVSRLAAEEAISLATSGLQDLEALLQGALFSAKKALADTMNINPVLKKAGVVDAGGQGYVLILQAMLSALRGEFKGKGAEQVPEVKDSTAFDAFDTEDITYAFDTVFIVRKHDENIDLTPLRAYLGGIGDCLVIGESDEEFKVHVHTNLPGDALNHAQQYGTLELAKIENMRTQHDDLLAGRKAQSTDDLEKVEQELSAAAEAEAEAKDEIAEPEKDIGFVAVCAGEGLSDLFRDLGVDRVVTGGQTMNPSTEDILREVNRTPASTVFVLPNNKNIIMAAEQCAPLTEKEVRVVPTRTVPQGIAAMATMDLSLSADELGDSLWETAQAVHTAQITYAARDSDFDGNSIHAGEYLALLDGKLLGSFTNLNTLLKELSWALEELEPEIITVYYGADVTEADADDVVNSLSGYFPDADVSPLNGGQPVYYYMISIE